MAFKKFGKKDSKQENQNKGTDSNALSMDDLSNVSGGVSRSYATSSEEYKDKRWACSSDFVYYQKNSTKTNEGEVSKPYYDKDGNWVYPTHLEFD